MIFGTYPCCDGVLAIEMPAQTPFYVKEECPHCGQVVWHRLSRLDPTSWTEAAFLDEFELDEATHTLRDKTESAAGATGGLPT